MPKPLTDSAHGAVTGATQRASDWGRTGRPEHQVPVRRVPRRALAALRAALGARVLLRHLRAVPRVSARHTAHSVQPESQSARARSSLTLFTSSYCTVTALYNSAAVLSRWQHACTSHQKHYSTEFFEKSHTELCFETHGSLFFRAHSFRRAQHPPTPCRLTSDMHSFHFVSVHFISTFFILQ